MCATGTTNSICPMPASASGLSNSVCTGFPESAWKVSGVINACAPCVITTRTSKPKSFATKANLERIMLLNKDQYQIDVNYEDLYDEFSESCGTKVTIKIKL